DVVPERARLEQPVVDELAPMRLVAVRVDPLVRAVAKPHLERCKRTCAGTGAENPDRELAPGQEALDEHGLTIVAEQRRARGYELRPRADERRGRDALAGALGDRLHEERQLEHDGGCLV